MIRIPDGVTPITDRRLTLVKILSSLTAENGRLDELKKAIKGAMKSKAAQFAQSDAVVAQLRKSNPREFANPKKLYDFVKARRITMAQFLDVICVRSSLLPALLSGEEIKSISATAGNAGGDDAGSLYTDLKPGVTLDIGKIEEAILGAVGG